MKKINPINILLLIVILNNIGCNGQNKQIENTPKQSINCYILKPILQNKEYKWLDKLPYLDTNMNHFLKYIFLKKDIKNDTIIGYITSFESQKRIFINEECFSNIVHLDSIDLSNIYFYSRFNTSSRTGLKIEFVKSYKKNILNLGNVEIFEYFIPNLSTVEANVFHIIIFENPNREQGDDLGGIVINSYGLEWKEVEAKCEIPIHLTNLRGGIQIKVPLYYDGNQFIPIGHFRGAW